MCELVRYFRRDIVLKGAWTGPAALELRAHALAPVNSLPVLEVVSAVHLIADFTLTLGRSFMTTSLEAVLGRTEL